MQIRIFKNWTNLTEKKKLKLLSTWYGDNGKKCWGWIAASDVGIIKKKLTRNRKVLLVEAFVTILVIRGFGFQLKNHISDIEYSNGLQENRIPF